MPTSRHVSAQVVLKPASGTTAGGRASVSSENVGDLLPSREAIAIARKTFTDAGFEVGDVVANSFSITAAPRTFEKALNTQLRLEPRSGVAKVVGVTGSETFELPTSALPEQARAVIEAIVFTPPPEFGPGSY